MSVEPDMSMQRKESDWHSALKTLGGGTLSVVLPVYNLAQTIEDNLSSVAAVLDGGGFPYELIPVDDYHERQLGRTLEILCEDYDPLQDLYSGRSFADSPDIDGTVWFSSEGPVSIGSFVPVKLEEIIDGELYGAACKEE